MNPEDEKNGPNFVHWARYVKADRAEQESAKKARKAEKEQPSNQEKPEMENKPSTKPSK